MQYYKYIYLYTHIYYNRYVIYFFCPCKHGWTDFDDIVSCVFEWLPLWFRLLESQLNQVSPTWRGAQTGVLTLMVDMLFVYK